MSSENLHEGETRKSAGDDIIEYVLLNDNNNNNNLHELWEINYSTGHVLDVSDIKRSDIMRSDPLENNVTRYLGTIKDF
jgi:hypothetical protein